MSAPGASNRKKAPARNAATQPMPRTMTLEREFQVSVTVKLPALGAVWVKVERA